jgi:hypothetical protein
MITTAFWLLPFDRIYDRNHRRFRRYLFGLECECGLAATADLDRLAGAGAYGVDSDDCRAVGKATNEQELLSHESIVLHRGNDSAYDFTEIHISVQRHLIDDADDCRIYRRVFATRCHAG